MTFKPLTDAVAFSNAHFGVGIGSQFLDNVACTGSETMLTSCSSSSSVYCSSGHNEDAGVRCQGSVNVQLYFRIPKFFSLTLKRICIFAIKFM